MSMYQLPDWLGGHRAHLVHGPDEAGEVTVDVWADGSPSGHHATVSESLLTRLADPDAPTPVQVLETPMGPNDADARTVRGYLVELLATVWREEEGFSGKRPWGNSGWQHELCDALAAVGYIETVEWGRHGHHVEPCVRAREMVAAAIEALAEAE